MRETYIKVMKWIAVSEGGYSNHPDDKGGPTNYGITQQVYHSYLARHGLLKKSVKEITQVEVAEIYQTQYANAVHYNELPAGVDYALLDYAINSGVTRAILAIQRIVNVEPDGHIGNITLGAISEHGPVDLIYELCNQRMRFLKRLKNFATFGDGWTKRVMGGKNGVQTNDIGVIDRATLLSINEQSIPEPIISTPKAAGLIL